MHFSYGHGYRWFPRAPPPPVSQEVPLQREPTPRRTPDATQVQQSSEAMRNLVRRIESRQVPQESETTSPSRDTFASLESDMRAVDDMTFGCLEAAAVTESSHESDSDEPLIPLKPSRNQENTPASQSPFFVTPGSSRIRKPTNFYALNKNKPRRENTVKKTPERRTPARSPVRRSIAAARLLPSLPPVPASVRSAMDKPDVKASLRAVQDLASSELPVQVLPPAPPVPCLEVLHDHPPPDSSAPPPSSLEVVRVQSPTRWSLETSSMDIPGSEIVACEEKSTSQIPASPTASNVYLPVTAAVPVPSSTVPPSNDGLSPATIQMLNELSIPVPRSTFTITSHSSGPAVPSPPRVSILEAHNFVPPSLTSSPPSPEVAKRSRRRLGALSCFQTASDEEDDYWLSPPDLTLRMNSHAPLPPR